jgi:hypothetical protein
VLAILKSGLEKSMSSLVINECGLCTNTYFVSDRMDAFFLSNKCCVVPGMQSLPQEKW